MEDIGNLARKPFEDNEESSREVDHYHAHGKNCEDMGHHLEKAEHTLPHEDEGAEPKEDHSEPAEDKGDESEKYAGMVRKIR